MFEEQQAATRAASQAQRIDTMANTTFTDKSGETFEVNSRTRTYTHVLMIVDRDGKHGMLSRHQSYEAAARRQQTKEHRDIAAYYGATELYILGANGFDVPEAPVEAPAEERIVIASKNWVIGEDPAYGETEAPSEAPVEEAPAVESATFAKGQQVEDKDGVVWTIRRITKGGNTARVERTVDGETVKANRSLAYLTPKS